MSDAATQPPAYAFLAHPPPAPAPKSKRPQRKPAPIHPPPATPRFSVRLSPSPWSTIASWASSVQPGSPAPASASPGPRRRGSFSRRPSITSPYPRRRPSVSVSVSGASPTSFSIIRTPSLADFKADLTAHGYAPVFVHLPNTPSTPSVYRPQPRTPPPSQQAKKTRTLRTFRSLGMLRRARVPNSPTKPHSPTKKRTEMKKSKAANKKTLYPPPLANELALMQFSGGGTMSQHAQALQAAQDTAGVGCAYKDAQGTLWWDADEALEYKHLLESPSHKENGWVQFVGPDGEERRESVSTQNLDPMSSQDSDLDPARAVQPADDLTAARPPLLAIAPRRRRSPGYMTVDAAALTGLAGNNRKTRRRPAPLALHPQPQQACTASSPGDARRAFLDASFAPAPAPAKVVEMPVASPRQEVPPPSAAFGMRRAVRKASRMQLFGFMTRGE